MAKAGRRYDIYLPLTFNDGRPIPRVHHIRVERQLLARFAGVTSLRREFPMRGVWQGESETYVDRVIVMTALDFRPRGSSRFIADLKRNLLRDFEQLEILITELSLRVH